MEFNLMKSTLFSLTGAAFAAVSAFFGGWDAVDPYRVWYAGDGQSLKGASSSDWYTADQAAAPRLPAKTQNQTDPAHLEAQRLAALWEDKYSSLLQRVKDVAQAG